MGLDYSYLNFPIQSLDRLQEIVTTNPSLVGLNVTIPHKINVLDFCGLLTDEANAIGAVNCIRIASDGKLEGHNTDWIGFKQSLEKTLKKGVANKALVLGTGGSSLAICYALERMGIPFQLVSRVGVKGCLTYSQLSKEVLQNHNIVVNTTPLGMFPNFETCPNIPYQFLSKQHICFDLIYNPEKTPFLSKAEQQGSTIKNGLEMLEIQAEESWKIWK